MQMQLASLSPRGQKRLDYATPVRLEFERFSGFITEFSGNISEGGMFIKTLTPPPVGTIFSFEFHLRDAIRILQGWGEVVWHRQAAAVTEQKPAGMGIKFVELDEASRNLIRRMVQTEKEHMSNQIPGNDDSGSSLEDLLNDPELADNSDLDQANAKTEALPLPKEFAEDSLSDEILSGDEVLEEVESTGRGKSWVIALLLLAILGSAGWYFRQTLMASGKTILFTFGLISAPTSTPVTNDMKPQASEPVQQQPLESVTSPQPSVAAATTPPSTPQAPAITSTPTPQASAPVAVAPTPVVNLPPAHKLRRLRQVEKDAQHSVFAIELDGMIATENLSFFPVETAPPRLVLDIPGIQQGIGKTSQNMQDSKVKRVRFGLHQNPDKIRLVFDLTQAAYESELRVEGSTIFITVKK